MTGAGVSESGPTDVPSGTSRETNKRVEVEIGVVCLVSSRGGEVDEAKVTRGIFVVPARREA